MKDDIFSSLTRSDKATIFPIYFSIFSFITTIGIYAYFYQKLPPKLPLFYSLQWGDSQLATRQQFLLLPAILIFINFINIVICRQLHSAHTLLKKLLIFNLILVDVIILATALKILMIFA